MMKPKRPDKPKLAATIAPLLLLLALLPVAARAAQTPAATIPATQPTPAAASPAVAPGEFRNTFTLADVGPADTIVMRGVDAFHTTYFSVPQTNIVKTATIKLRYHFSPGLLPNISHLNVSLNGTQFASLPVVLPLPPPTMAENDRTTSIGKGQLAVTPQTNALLETTLALPVEMLVHDNQLTFEFVGHYTTNCEDPGHTTLWAKVDTDSSIELRGSLLPLQNDLKLLPLPFYDKAVNLHPTFPIVFLTMPTQKSMQAAGILASYFGQLSDSRAARFPVSVGTIPSGNVLLISESSSGLSPQLGLAGVTGPTVAMRPNPSDPYSKALVLAGGTPEELLLAVRAFVMQASSLAGDTATLQPRAISPRKPDDAPRWLPTDRIVTLGEYTRNSGGLQGDSSGPIVTYFRLPPDLYLNGVGANLAFKMDYRYNPMPLANSSTLQVYMNDAYVSSTPTPHGDKPSAALSTVIPVPIVDMRPFSNSLKMQFSFAINTKGPCQDSPPLNLMGRIDSSSYLDIRDIPHWTQMPNLEIFANAGYPFTRMADLSDTTVVLPDAPSTEEIELFVTLMGHFGAQTGYPVLNVTVTDTHGISASAKKDYLILGTVGGIQGAMDAVGSALPVKVSGSGLQIEDTQGFFTFLQKAWWRVESSERVSSGKLETAGTLPDAIIEGIEWPKGSERSVVLVALRDKSIVANFLPVFLKTSQSSDIAQSVSVLKGDRFASYRIGNQAYHVGSLSLYAQSKIQFAQNPWLYLLILVCVCFLIAVLLRSLLRRRARARLLGEQ